ncbi:hypothetical protein O9929_16915 [Vibrio lentus]|nr:hypothetical protein [Vibrio lentus]
MKYLDKFDVLNCNEILASESEQHGVLNDLGCLNSTHLREDIGNVPHKLAFNLVKASEVYGLARDKGLLGQFHEELDSIGAAVSAEQKVELYLFNDLIEKGTFDPSVLYLLPLIHGKLYCFDRCCASKWLNRNV